MHFTFHTRTSHSSPTPTMGILERIREVEDEMARTQKNKATEHHLGLLKAKLARFRTQLLEGDKSGGGKKGDGFDVQKSGDARIALIGFPSVGKSTLLSKLTKTQSETASYEFTTLTCIPGVIEHRGTRIQLLDLPGIIEGAAGGKGRGRQVIATARTADMVLMLLDAAHGDKQRALLEAELETMGIRLNKTPPQVYYKQKTTGGLKITVAVPQSSLDDRLIHAIFQQYRIHHAEVVIREDITADDFIDVIEGNRVYMKCLYVYNKIDTYTIGMVDRTARRPNSVVISCQWDANLDYLLDRIWEMLAMVRVYTKPRGNLPDFSEPIVLRGDDTVEGACRLVHRDMLDKFKYAFVWGASAKHNRPWASFEGRRCTHGRCKNIENCMKPNSY